MKAIASRALCHGHNARSRGAGIRYNDDGDHSEARGNGRKCKDGGPLAKAAATATSARKGQEAGINYRQALHLCGCAAAELIAANLRVGDSFLLEHCAKTHDHLHRAGQIVHGRGSVAEV